MTSTLINPTGRNAIIPLPADSRKSDSYAAVLDNAKREAEALAWSTDFPQLFLPCLEEELLDRARNYWAHQARVRSQSARLLEITLPEDLRRRAA